MALRFPGEWSAQRRSSNDTSRGGDRAVDVLDVALRDLGDDAAVAARDVVERPT